jgi:hypothetical protein
MFLENNLLSIQKDVQKEQKDINFTQKKVNRSTQHFKD